LTEHGGRTPTDSTAGIGASQKVCPTRASLVPDVLRQVRAMCGVIAEGAVMKAWALVSTRFASGGWQRSCLAQTPTHCEQHVPRTRGGTISGTRALRLPPTGNGAGTSGQDRPGGYSRRITGFASCDANSATLRTRPLCSREQPLRSWYRGGRHVTWRCRARRAQRLVSCKAVCIMSKYVDGRTPNIAATRRPDGRRGDAQDPYVWRTASN